MIFSWEVRKWGSEVLGVRINLHAVYSVFKINRSVVCLWVHSSEINGICKTWKHRTNNRYLFCNCHVNCLPHPLFSLLVSFAQCYNPQIRYKTFGKRTRGCYIAFMHYVDPISDFCSCIVAAYIPVHYNYRRPLQRATCGDSSAVFGVAVVAPL